MKKILAKKKIHVINVFVFLCFFSINSGLYAHEDTDAIVKFNFFKGYLSACIPNQVDNPQNKTLSTTQLVDYCICSSEYVLDIITTEQIASMERGDTHAKTIVPLMQMATTYCRKRIK